MGKHSRPSYYRLDGYAAVPIPGEGYEAVLEFVKVLEASSPDRQVAFTQGPGWDLSTVFLGYDHNYLAVAMGLSPEEAPPLIFETALFRPDDSCEILKRYSTWDEALTGHNLYLTRIKSDSGVL